MRCPLRSVYAEHKEPVIGTVGVQSGQHLTIVADNLRHHHQRVRPIFMHESSSICVPLPLDDRQNPTGRILGVICFAPATPRLLARASQVGPHEPWAKIKRLQSCILVPLPLLGR